MGARSRRKGANFERAVARKLRDLGVEAKRGLQSRGGGAEQADVMSALPYHFECKAGKRPNVWAAYEQACNDAQEGRAPCVIMHRDQAKPGEGATELMVLPLDVGLDLLVEHAQQRFIEGPLPKGVEGQRIWMNAGNERLDCRTLRKRFQWYWGVDRLDWTPAGTDERQHAWPPIDCWCDVEGRMYEAGATGYRYMLDWEGATDGNDA